MLANVRTELYLLKKSVESKTLKEILKDNIIDIDIIGCELSQNIARNYKKIE
jgi:hypothetical protein